MVKIWQLTRAARRRGAGGYDLVVLDAPATGHALGLLQLAADVRGDRAGGPDRGPDQAGAGAARRPRAHAPTWRWRWAPRWRSPRRSSCRRRSQSQLGRELEAVIVNGLLPRRFTAEELERSSASYRDIQMRAAAAPGSRPRRGRRRCLDAAARAARAVHERARLQHNQVARLRRRSFEVFPIPFVWGPELDLAAVRGISSAARPQTLSTSVLTAVRRYCGAIRYLRVAGSRSSSPTASSVVT